MLVSPASAIAQVVGLGPVEGAHSASAGLWHDMSARRRPRDGHGVANDHWDRVLDILGVAVWHVP